MFRLVLFIITLLPFTSYSQQKPIIIWEQLHSHPSPMVKDLLLRALELSYGTDFKIELSSPMEQQRALNLLSTKSDLLDIAVFAPTVKRERNAIPVRIPVTGMLLSYRICLINIKSEITDYDVYDQTQLRNLTIGQHRDWPDTAVFQHNGFNVLTSSIYQLLFKQLSGKRFDCFARGANEIEQELERHPQMDLMIEPSIMFYYPQPLFYFVNKDKPELAQSIKKGLNKMLENGEYEDIYLKYYQTTLNDLGLHQRYKISLTNPIVSFETLEAIEDFNKKYPEFNILGLHY